MFIFNALPGEEDDIAPDALPLSAWPRPPAFAGSRPASRSFVSSPRSAVRRTVAHPPETPPYLGNTPSAEERIVLSAARMIRAETMMVRPAWP